MDLLIVGIEIAALVAPTIGAIVLLARQRAIGERQHRAEMNALRVALVGERLAPVAFASCAANERLQGSVIEQAYASGEETRTRRVGGISRPMADVVKDILAERYAVAGVAEPLTTPQQREALVSCLSDGFRDAVACALTLGLAACPADLPEATPFQLLGRTLLYRQGANEEAWILCGVALRLLARAGIESNEADAVMLAADIAGAYELLDVPPAAVVGI